jgi:hypothetical protein
MNASTSNNSIVCNLVGRWMYAQPKTFAFPILCLIIILFYTRTITQLSACQLNQHRTKAFGLSLSIEQLSKSKATFNFTCVHNGKYQSTGNLTHNNMLSRVPKTNQKYCVRLS